jgi:hypothetical protein
MRGAEAIRVGELTGDALVFRQRQLRVSSPQSSAGGALGGFARESRTRSDPGRRIISSACILYSTRKGGGPNGTQRAG